MAAPADHAAVPDPQHRHRAEVLAGHHPGGQRHLGTDQGALADRDPALTEERTGRERRHRAAAERGELPPGRGVRGHHAVPLRGLEGPVHRPPAQPAKQGPAAHLPAEEGAEAGAEEGVEAGAAEAAGAGADAGEGAGGEEGAGADAEAASWPQAPSISRPRVSRTVTGTPCASSRRTNSRCAAGRDAVHFEPGVGLSGIRLTWASFPASSEPSSSARQAWSLMSLIRAYSIETRRPVVAA